MNKYRLNCNFDPSSFSIVLRKCLPSIWVTKGS